MSDYAGVTPIPKELDLEGWYEIVAGDHIPAKWFAWWVFPSGKAQSQVQVFGLTNVQSTAWIQDGVRIFTRTPVPTAIKRIRAAETKQDELPVEPASLPAELQELRDKLVGHTDPEAMDRRIHRLELSLKKLNERLNNYIDGA